VDVQSYQFDTTLWVAQGNGAWHFVSLPEQVSDDILEQVGTPGRGFGSVRVGVTVGDSRWDTSIFPDSKRGTYVLPIKKAVRTAEGLAEGDVVTVGVDLIDR
jgi:hypothetical protein